MNLFELFVKVGVDDQASGKVEKLSEKLGNGLKTAAKVGIAAVGAAATAIGTLTTMAVNNYAEYEQLVGGAELMFGDAYETVAKNAKEAYKTVQMSQNDYLQQVNGFATGLKTALGGNEQAAADLAHKIIQAEADVVAATGETQENIQNAFNGIMKSNFQMLDNLKIGITPTKEGFQEVIDKVNEWNEANGRATEYQMGNLADMQSALVDYIEMVGMSEYAQNEAAGTITGSIASMKAAWENLVTALADENANLDPLIENLVSSVETVLSNVIPKIGVALNSTIKLVKDLIPVIVQEIPLLIEQNLPLLAEAAVGLVHALIDGISSSKDTLINTALEVALFLVDSFIGVLPQIAQLGMDILVTLAEGLAESLPQLVPTVTQVILEIARILTDPTSLGRIIDAAVTILGELARGLVDAIPSLVDTAIKIVSGLVGFLVDPETLEPMLGGAESIVQSLATALTKAAVKLMEAAVALVAFLTEALTSEGNASKIATEALSVVLTLVNGIIAEADEMVEAAAALINALTIALLSPESLLEILRAAENLCIELSRGITESVFHIAEAGENAVQEFLDKFEGVDWESLGLGWMEKIASGLSKGWSKVVEWLEGVREKILEYADFVRDAVNETIDAWKGEDNSPSIEDFSEELASFHEERIKAMKSGQISPGGYINPNAQPLGSTVNVTQNIYSSAKTPSELMTEAYYQQKLGAMN